MTEPTSAPPRETGTRAAAADTTAVERERASKPYTIGEDGSISYNSPNPTDKVREAAELEAYTAGAVREFGAVLDRSVEDVLDHVHRNPIDRDRIVAAERAGQQRVTLLRDLGVEG